MARIGGDLEVRDYRLRSGPPKGKSRGYVPGAMVATPWGDSSELRERRMAPGRGTPRPEVERNQRERLYGAMVAVVAEKGYEATTIADLAGWFEDDLGGGRRGDEGECEKRDRKCAERGSRNRGGTPTLR